MKVKVNILGENSNRISSPTFLKYRKSFLFGDQQVKFVIYVCLRRIALQTNLCRFTISFRRVFGVLEFVELFDSIAMLNHQAKIDSDIYLLQVNDSKRKKAKLIKTGYPKGLF